MKAFHQNSASCSLAPWTGHDSKHSPLPSTSQLDPTMRRARVFVCVWLEWPMTLDPKHLIVGGIGLMLLIILVIIPNSFGPCMPTNSYWVLYDCSLLLDEICHNMIYLFIWFVPPSIWTTFIWIFTTFGNPALSINLSISLSNKALNNYSVHYDLFWFVKLYKWNVFDQAGQRAGC